MFLSIVARSLRYWGFVAFRPLCMCCVRVLISFVVEFLPLFGGSDVGGDFRKDWSFMDFEKVAK